MVRLEKDRKAKYLNRGGRVNCLQEEEEEEVGMCELKAGEQKQKYGCRACKQANKGRSCTHCFYCGEDSHKISDCDRLERKQNADNKADSNETSSNSNRPPARD